MISCPNCKSTVNELLACDSCDSIGCVRCITRFNKQWLCKNCKDGNKVTTSSSESNLWSMFG